MTANFTDALGGIAEKITAGRQNKPRLFYYEEAVNCWIPAPEKLEHILELSMFSSDEEVIEIQFKRVDMTDQEFGNMPEAS